jgi:hypothetical protein
MKETGWLIESKTSWPEHRWLRVVSYTCHPPYVAKLVWEPDSNVALRFARESDAIDFAKLHPDFCALALITEHAWGDGSASIKRAE